MAFFVMVQYFKALASFALAFLDTVAKIARTSGRLLLAKLRRISASSGQCARLRQFSLLTGASVSDAAGITFSRRRTTVASSFLIRDAVDYVEVEYMVSPPGDRCAKMSQMKLKLRFEGKEDGNIRVWWNRPRRFRDEDSYKFGLGAIEVKHDLDAYDPDVLSFNSFGRKKEVAARSGCWSEHEFEGEDLMGGILRVMIWASFPCSGILSVLLSAVTSDEDPRDEPISFTDEEMDEYVLDSARRWSSLSYQRQVLGGETMEEYLEH